MGYMMKNITYIIQIILVTLLHGGCVSEENVPSPIGYGDPYVTFELRIPGMSASTRAMTANDENTIKTVDLFAFHQDGTYAYRSNGTEVDASDGKFSVQLRVSESGESYTFVFIANARDEVESVISGFAPETTTKQDLLQALTFESKRWTTESATMRYLPMWGEYTTPIVVTEDLYNQHIGTVYMLRSVARLDIGVNFDNSSVPAGLSHTFYIKSVSVCNNQQYGRIAPDAGNLSANVSGYTAHTPTLVSSSAKNTVQYQHATPDLGFVKEIYVSEARNAGQTDANRMFLILEAIYIEGGGSPVDGTPTYYRLDFIEEESDGSFSYPDVLRNHYYTFNIIAVNSKGYPNPNEAIHSDPIGIVYEMKVYEDGDINYIDYTNTYMLGVNELTLRIPPNQQTLNSYLNNLYVLSDYKYGWTLDAVTDPDGVTPCTWLSTDKTNDTSQTSVLVKLLADENMLNTERSAILTISAGRLTLQVTVVQEIYDSQLYATPDITATPTILMLGESPIYKTINVHSNIRWYMTPTLSQMGGYSSLSLANNTRYGVNYDRGSEVFPFRIMGRAFSKEATTPAAGTTYDLAWDLYWDKEDSGNSSNVQKMNEIPVVRRVVPAYFDILYIQASNGIRYYEYESIPPNGFDGFVIAECNCRLRIDIESPHSNATWAVQGGNDSWKLYNDTDPTTTIVDSSVGAYQNKLGYFIIPNNIYNVGRWITFTYTLDDGYQQEVRTWKVWQSGMD